MSCLEKDPIRRMHQIIMVIIFFLIFGINVLASALLMIVICIIVYTKG